MAQSAPNTLQAALGYTFRDPQLLVKALTHSSLAYEQTLEGRQADGMNCFREEDNEQLEFLGDVVLGLVVADILFRRFPDLHEGEWTRLRASLVSRRHLAQVASALDLGSYLRLGRGEERVAGARSLPCWQIASKPLSPRCTWTAVLSRWRPLLTRRWSHLT